MPGKDEAVKKMNVTQKMNLTWKPMPLAKGETAGFNGIKLGIIRHNGNVWAAYVGNRKLTDSKSKKEALKGVTEEIEARGRLF